MQGCQAPERAEEGVGSDGLRQVVIKTGGAALALHVFRHVRGQGNDGQVPRLRNVCA